MRFSQDQTRFSSASVNASIAGITLIGIQDLTIDDEVTAELMYGAGGQPIGAPAGQWKGAFSFPTIPEEFDNLVQGIGPGYSGIIVPGTVTLYEPNGAGSFKIGLPKLRILKGSYKMGKAGGSEPSTFEVAGILLAPPQWNGITSVLSTPTLSDIVSYGLGLFGL